MIKDTSETDKQDAERFRADLKKVKLELEENELSLLESKEQCDFDLEREIHELQDSLDQAQAANTNINEWYHHELEFHSEVYTIRQDTRFHPFNECELLMCARPIATWIAESVKTLSWIKTNKDTGDGRQVLKCTASGFQCLRFAKYSFSYTCWAVWNFLPIQYNAMQFVPGGLEFSHLMHFSIYAR